MNEIFSDESWVVRYWRPVMAWMYTAICIFDFILAPILFTIIQADAGTAIQWQPMTMKAGGLFHVAMGAVIGVTAWSRGQEKIRYMEYFVPTQNQSTETPDAEPVSKESITK